MTVFAIDVNLMDLSNLKKCLLNVYPDIKVFLHSEINSGIILRAIDEIKPNCIIVEAELGNSDGIGLAKLIRQKYPTPNICITNESSNFSSQAWEIHANSYLIKPISENKIRKYL